MSLGNIAGIVEFDGADGGSGTGAATAAEAATALSLENALRSAVILTVFVLLLCTSVANIVVLWCRFSEVISIYLIGLSMADLFCALFIIPFSLYSSLWPGWAFAGDNSVFCKCTVYAHMVLLSSTVFTFAWISVDRYAAFMKPSRYEAVHTVTRCKCWILFSWTTSLLLACPVLIAKMETNYSAHLELCLLNLSSTMAYSTTVGVLVLLPSMCTVALTFSAILAAINKPEELEDLQRSILETDHNFVISLFILISFVLSWSPLIAFQFLPSHLLDQSDSAVMRFAFTWLAIGGGSSKLLIYSFTSKQFRHTLCCCLLPRTDQPHTLASPLSEPEWNGHTTGTDLLPNSVPLANSTTPTTTAAAAATKRQLPTTPEPSKLNHHQQQQQSTTTNVRSPIASSFLSTIDYGSFGLGPTGGGGFVPQNHLLPSSPQQQQQQQQRHLQHDDDDGQQHQPPQQHQSHHHHHHRRHADHHHRHHSQQQQHDYCEQ